MQLRAGYMANMYFNTVGIGQPVAFNFGALDAHYVTQGFRLVHGFNVGFGLFF